MIFWTRSGAEPVPGALALGRRIRGRAEDWRLGVGHLFVLIGASGVGKTTLANRAQAEGIAARVVTCTTRPPRPHEVPDVDYHFLDPGEFARREGDGAFVETEAIHGHRYGVLTQDLSEALSQPLPAVISMGYGGAERVKALWPARVTVVGIVPPTLDHLRVRLRDRGTSAEEAQLRLRAVEAEAPQVERLADLVIVNDNLDTAYDRLRGAMVAAAG
jgi:guanylate kinase